MIAECKPVKAVPGLFELARLTPAEAARLDGPYSVDRLFDGKTQVGRTCLDDPVISNLSALVHFLEPDNGCPSFANDNYGDFIALDQYVNPQKAGAGEWHQDSNGTTTKIYALIHGGKGTEFQTATKRPWFALPDRLYYHANLRHRGSKGTNRLMLRWSN